MAKYDLLVAGEINPDLILTDPNLEPKFGQVEVLVENATLTVGSSSVIFACGAARLGLKVAFLGVVGDDMFGRFMLEAMEDKGIDISSVIIDPDQGTGFTVILNKVKDRGMITYMGAINALAPDQVSNKLLSQTRHLHIASYFLQTKLRPGVLDVFSRAKVLGVTSSLDTNWDPENEWVGLDEILPVTDVFLPNEAEGEALSGKHNPEEIVTVLSAKAGRVAMKLGADGAIAKQGGQMIRLPAPHVGIVDTVGAGDSFDAGFIYGFLHEWSLEESLKLGIACGSLSTLGPGGTSAQPTLKEAQAYMEKIYQED